MRSLELKKLEIKDDIPLYVSLDSLTTWDKNENSISKVKHIEVNSKAKINQEK